MTGGRSLSSQAKRKRLLGILAAIEGGGAPVRLASALVRQVPASELPRVAKVVASLVRTATRYRPSKNPPKRKGKANPVLMTIGNPVDMDAAKRAYKRFHGVEPAPSAIKFGSGEGVLIALGELARIDYRPRKGQRRGPTWFHHFKPGCVLCTDPEGRRLVVLDRHGKRLVDFDRGIIR